ncbi:MAG: anthranilate synthase component II, partial [Burkholderiaceae bacterium]
MTMPKPLTGHRLLMIDNYDSFTYNLVQYFGELGAQVQTIRNDDLSVDDALGLKPDGIVISPGPCSPAQAGISVALIQAVAARPKPLPLLGVCLGHQAIGEAFGAKV